jgi:hypothetical protein
MSISLSEPAKMLLLGSLLAKQRIISNNAKAFLKEMILRRDPRLARVLSQFEDKTANDAEFLENIHELISKYIDANGPTCLRIERLPRESLPPHKTIN